MGILTKTNIESTCDFCSQMGQYASMYAISKNIGLDIAFRLEDLGYSKYGYYLQYPFIHKPSIVQSIDNLIQVQNISEIIDPTKNYNIVSDIALYTNFHEYEQDIKNLFKFDATLEAYARNCFESNLKEDEIAVSIHFRRGDYLLYSSLNLSLDYYYAAVETLKKKLNTDKTIKFFIFSNEIDWVSQNFQLDNAIYVYTPINQIYDKFIDFCVMSYCSHNIIANSSYSFWAAYLNPNPNKIVICPYYYGSGDNGVNGKYYPTTWTPLMEV